MTEERCAPNKVGFAAEVEKKIQEHEAHSGHEFGGAYARGSALAAGDPDWQNATGGAPDALSRESIRAAIGTEERRIWLDPEDIDAITDDVLALIRSSAP